MKCSICRTDLPDGSGSCPECGSKTFVPRHVSGPAPDRTLHAATPTADRGLAPGWEEAPTGDDPAETTSVSDATGPLEAGQAFGSRYHVIRLLGAGGMGAVYQAWDAELGVAVAIKVIRPSIMADPMAGAEVERRFKRELLLARQVTHTNVVRIHDLGEIRGIKYITMTYVDGVDLATRLKRQGKQTVAETLRIARSIVSGLAAAHSAGVVHRDLKPANIMIDRQGEALIMDFGIAHSTGSAQLAQAAESLPSDLRRSAVDMTSTIAGSVVGTIGYMAPEQARGEPVDQRTDIYSFGLILYDALTGRPRGGPDESAISELHRRLVTPLPPLRGLAPDVPEPLAQLIARCVEPEPSKRYQTTAELAADLAKLDDGGELIPVKRTVGLPLVMALAAFLLSVTAGTWWYSQLPPPPPPEPVSVVIADIENRTGDAAFDQTLEVMLRRALEGAGFITAYDRSRVRSLDVPQPDRLDEQAATQLAVKQGLRVVLAGSIASDRGGYSIALRATQPVNGEEIVNVRGRASGRDQVIEQATRLIVRVRQALGDDTSESAQQFAMGSLSATSLDVVRLYARALEASSGNRHEEARDHALQAVERDPEFGIGYLLLAAASRNLGRLDDDRRYTNEALRHLGGMTERERFSTRGYSYYSTGDYQQCVKEYSELIAHYPSDVGGRNQLALCQSHLRNMAEAVRHMRAVVDILPRRTLFRVNLSLYANYAGEFETAEREARSVEETDAHASLALAFSQIARGQVNEARQTYEALTAIDDGASFAASGLGDLAAYQGRFGDAVRILRAGAAADLEAKVPENAAAKLVAVADAERGRGRNAAAIAAASEALAHSRSVKVRFLAARTFIEAGDSARARPLIQGLAGELYAEPRAHARILEGLVQLKAGDPRGAMTILREANTIFDTWIGHYELGRASLEAGAPAQADSEFDVCLRRRGEALALFVDEEPTYAYLPGVLYYQGRAREALQTAQYADSYRQYLALRGESKEDPLLTDIRRRLDGSRR